MIIKYEFANGDKVELEVSDEIGKAIKDSYKAEKANDERNRYHNLSIEQALYEGKAFGYSDCGLRRLERDDELKDKKRRNKKLRRDLKLCFSRLTYIQRKRIWMAANGLSERQIADIEGVDHKVVHRSLVFARKKFQKIFQK